MKLSDFFVPALALCFATGCATPLSIPRDGERLAKVADVPMADLQFISHCGFAEGPARWKSLDFRDGVIVVSPESIQLLQGSRPTFSGGRHIVIPFSSMNRVAFRHWGRVRQVQVYVGDRVVAIEVRKKEGTEYVFQTIKDHAIPVWEGERFYGMTIGIWGVPVSLP